ncbi:MAG: YceI family protein, partial [Solirubrobacterales bacterium]|nr:YceI family protein [Solirubrobacterales bacterium]
MAQRFGPDNAHLTIRTARTGAASRAGHDLLIEVGSWEATLDPAGDPALTLTADSRSLRVLEGTGGVKALDDDDKTNIAKTIDDEVLKGCGITFRSNHVDRRADGGLTVAGELELGGRRGPVEFDLASRDGRLSGEAVVKQTAFGIKPYSALFGTLKVADEVRIEIDAQAS